MRLRVGEVVEVEGELVDVSGARAASPRQPPWCALDVGDNACEVLLVPSSSSQELAAALPRVRAVPRCPSRVVYQYRRRPTIRFNVLKVDRDTALTYRSAETYELRLRDLVSLLFTNGADGIVDGLNRKGCHGQTQAIWCMSKTSRSSNTAQVFNKFNWLSGSLSRGSACNSTILFLWVYRPLDQYLLCDASGGM
jgi:hypothetical protein